MSDNTVIVTALSSLVSLFGLMWLFFWLYRRYSVDRFRQEMFEIRDKLFDYARTTGLEFDSQAYIIPRQTMNGFIRFADRLTLSQIIFNVILGKKDDIAVISKQFQEVWCRATQGLDKKTANELEDLRDQINQLVLKYLIFGSPLLLITLLIPLLSSVLISTSVTAIMRLLERPFNDLNSAAILYGSDSAQQVC